MKDSHGSTANSSILELDLDVLKNVIDYFYDLSDSLEEEITLLEDDITITEEVEEADFVDKDAALANEEISDIKSELETINNLIPLLEKYYKTICDGDGNWKNSSNNININGTVFKEAIYYFKLCIDENSWVSDITSNSDTFQSKYVSYIESNSSILYENYDIINEGSIDTDDSALMSKITNARTKIDTASKNMEELNDLTSYCSQKTYKVVDNNEDIISLGSILDDGVITISELLNTLTDENLSESDSYIETCLNTYSTEVDLVENIFSDGIITETEVDLLYDLLQLSEGNNELSDALIHKLRSMSAVITDSEHRSILNQFAAIIYDVNIRDLNLSKVDEDGSKFYILEFNEENGLYLDCFIVNAYMDSVREWQYVVSENGKIVYNFYQDQESALFGMKDSDSNHYISEAKYDDLIAYFNNLATSGVGFIKPIGFALELEDYGKFSSDTAKILSSTFGGDAGELESFIDTVLENNPSMTMPDLLEVLEKNNYITDEEKKYIMNWETYSTVLTSTEYGIDITVIQDDHEKYSGMYSDAYYSANPEMYEINEVIINLYNFENGNVGEKENAREFLEPYFSLSTGKGENLDSAIQGFINLSFENGEIKEYNLENFTKDGVINADDIINKYDKNESTYSEIQDLIDDKNK